jgi:hypothetical protein
MPGDPGNLISKALNLSIETVPPVSVDYLQQISQNPELEIKSFDRYSLCSINNQDIPKFEHNLLTRVFNNRADQQYSCVVYATTPVEFSQIKNSIDPNGNNTYYFIVPVEETVCAEDKYKASYMLNLNKFDDLVAEYHMSPIKLSKILTGTCGFLQEYDRLTNELGLTKDSVNAEQLYHDWYIDQMPPESPLVSKAVDIVSRAPNDDFTYNLFLSALPEIQQEYNAYYVWTNPACCFKTWLATIKPTAPVVFIGIKDLLDQWTEFDYWNDAVQRGSQILTQKFKKYYDTKFILATSLENLDLEIREPNVSLVSWGGDITNQQDQYTNLDPVLDKNFNSKKTYITLNRNGRQHRMFHLSYLYGRNLNEQGILTYLDLWKVNSPSEFLEKMPWNFEVRHGEIKELVCDGYKKLYYDKKDLQVDPYEIYDKTNNNVGNFNNSLRAKYQNVFVEIVSESSFSAPAYNVTEKTLNSFYACNFPIILGGRGIVQQLRDMGFDMFDDIINHSYDNLDNPIDRITSAIDSNIQMLTDSGYVKSQWQACRGRFENNVAVAKTIYRWYEDRFKKQIRQLTS